MNTSSHNVPPELTNERQQQKNGPDLERIRNAKKGRIMQLKRWTQYDKAKEKEETSRLKKGSYPRKGMKSVRFNQNLILLEASNQGDIEEVRRLLSEGACADVANSDGLSALHQCAINKNIDMCRLLINYKANVNAKDREHWTSLHAAARIGHTDICILLIRSGADLLALNIEANMPYDICEDENTLDAIEKEMASRGITQKMIDEARNVPEKTMLNDLKIMFIKYGHNSAMQMFTQLDKQGANMLHIAASCGFGDVIRYLISLGFPLDSVDKDGWQAIHIAALYSQLEVVEILISNGVNIDVKTKQGETVYELVYDKEMYDKLMLLKSQMEKAKDSRNLSLTSVGLIRRCSSTNPRSESIRRTSLKEKSLLSRKEAKQEAGLRLMVEEAISDNNNSISYIDDFVNANLRSKLKVVPETTTEVDYGGSDFGGNDTRLGITDKNVRGSFTHSHPYNSPTRDPVPNISSPPNINKISPKTEQPPKLRHSMINDRSSSTMSITNMPHPHRSSQEIPDIKHPSPRLKDRGSHILNMDPKSKDHASNNQSKDRGSNNQPKDRGCHTLNKEKCPGIVQRPHIVSSPPPLTNISSVRSASNHTTPIGSVRSSQISLQRSPVKEEPRKQISNRYLKSSKPGSCCSVM